MNSARNECQEEWHCRVPKHQPVEHFECHIITRYYSKPKYMLRTQLKHSHSFSLAFYEPEYSQHKINENTLGKANSFSVLSKVSQSTWAVTTIKNKYVSYRMTFTPAISPLSEPWALMNIWKASSPYQGTMLPRLDDDVITAGLTW